MRRNKKSDGIKKRRKKKSDGGKNATEKKATEIKKCDGKTILKKRWHTWNTIVNSKQNEIGIQPKGHKTEYKRVLCVQPLGTPSRLYIGAATIQ